MSIMTRTLILFHSAVLSLAYCSCVLAEDQAPAHPDRWPCWHTMNWPAYWWIFPLIFFVLMVSIFAYMMRKGSRGWMWCGPWMDRPGFRNTMKRSWDEPSESAMEILKKRYAKGEISKQEYEEIKSAITRSE